jgi:hypothetical protein
MLRRFGRTRRIVTSWILGTALALVSVAAALADGGGPGYGH